MKADRRIQRIETEEEVSIEATESLSSDTEFSLEELSAAYSKLIGKSSDSSVLDSNHAQSPSTAVELGDEGPLDLGKSDHFDDPCPVTGRSIIEAVLFVGNPENAGLQPETVATMMRGVKPSEVVEWIAELNQVYADQGHAMRIVADEKGYRMTLSSELQSVGDSLFGKLREAQLNQAAIDCLSLVAYRPGTTKEAIELLWNRPAGSILGLLVRRDLLRIEREGKGKQAITRYFTTDRLLNLLGIASLDDLPIAESEFE